MYQKGQSVFNVTRITALLGALVCLAAPALADVRLIMVEQPGCAYCAAWDDEIAPMYPKTEEGSFAPLQRAQLRDGAPDGVVYDRRVNFTPTFILVEEGAEVARLEGYPGEHFFWPVLSEMLTRHTDFSPTKTESSQ
ncbi:thioredoxin family protein [Roseivivax sp. CAU 1753]